MTLEHEIEREAKEANDFEKAIEEYQNYIKLSGLEDDAKDLFWEEIEQCKKWADEHRRRERWFRALMAYRDAYEEIRGLTKVWEEGAGIEKCIAIIEKHVRGVKTDGERDKA